MATWARDYKTFFKLNSVEHRALTPILGNGALAHGIGKISSVLTKIGKIFIVYMHEISIARLIQIVNLILFLEIYKTSFKNKTASYSRTILVPYIYIYLIFPWILSGKILIK